MPTLVVVVIVAVAAAAAAVTLVVLSRRYNHLRPVSIKSRNRLNLITILATIVTVFCMINITGGLKLLWETFFDFLRILTRISKDILKHTQVVAMPKKYEKSNSFSLVDQSGIKSSHIDQKL